MPAAEPDPSFSETRAASLWPDSQHAGRSTTFAASRFDPIAEERARNDALSAAAFDVCHPALALRAVLLVQAALAVAALAQATSLADWGQRQAAFAFAGIAGTLLWLVLLCAARRPLRKAGPPLRAALVLTLGAIVALCGWL